MRKPLPKSLPKPARKSVRKFSVDKSVKQRLIIIAVFSFVLASALELYTFGIPSDFLLRWFRSFFVIFTLISLTVFGIIPGVDWLVNKVARR